MRILAFVDMHGSLRAYRKIAQKAKRVDLIVCAGDISFFEQNIPQIVKKLRDIKKPILIVHGNHETKEVMNLLSSGNMKFIHKKIHKHKKYNFLGYGGGGFSLTDKEFERWTKKIKKGIRNIILVTHAPPHGTKVDRIIETHCGNKSITKFIKKNKPKLVICGHLHENAGVEDKIGKTRVVNPGPFGKVINLK